MYLKKIIRKLLRKESKKDNLNNLQYFDNSEEDLSLSNITLDLRDPIYQRKYVKLGTDSSVNANLIFETQEGFVSIGNRTFIGGATIICRNNISIGNNVQIAWNCLLYDHNAHSFDFLERRKDIDIFLNNKKNKETLLKGKNWDVVHSAPITICNDVWIGTNVTILNGVTIGEGAVIGAGSVVREDIPAWTIAYGNPCKVVAKNKYHP